LQVLFFKGNLIVVDVLVGALETLIQELEIRFPTRGVMDILGIVYP